MQHDIPYSGYHDPDGLGWRQRDLTPRVVYDQAYYDRVCGAIAHTTWATAAARLRLLDAVAGGETLLDYGCGAGQFAELARSKGWRATGYDLVPGPGPRMTDLSGYDGAFDVVTFFDSLEHLPDPVSVIRSLSPYWLMVSVPWCHLPYRQNWFLPWRHRKPGEHLWHWGRETLTTLLESCGYAVRLAGDIEDDYRGRLPGGESNILTVIARRKKAV